MLQLAHLASHYISAHVESHPRGKPKASVEGKKRAREQTTGCLDPADGLNISSLRCLI